ncbi:hypothetical protein BC835DRAFT_418851 [Cytidiella melzeri]|nr:hypothetical protein BC835DRAFT_418851 [Cytidiella melzeri]
MSSDSTTADSVRQPPPSGNEYDSNNAPLDPSFYDVDVEFLSKLTGITDPEELKQHVLRVQAEAYAVHPYPCIKLFTFARTKINHYPAYSQLLKLGKERKDVVFLDLGCCVGNDIRRAVLDGFPASRIIGSDLNPGFWDVGHELFKSTPGTFPVKFLPGNIFEPSFFDPSTTPSENTPDLSGLTSLIPLTGRVSAIHASAFFHLFNEARQLELATLFAALLSPESGSVAFGSHIGLQEKGLRLEVLQPGQKDAEVRMFCHSPESWKEMVEGVFGKGKVDVWATLKEIQRKDYVKVNEKAKFYMLVWSVTRL